MHFGLSEEQQLLQETLVGLADAECPPARLRAILDEGSGFDAKLWGSLAETGLAGLLVPERHGGAGLGIVELALVAEVAGRGALPGPLLEHSLACLAIARGGTEEQQARLLPALAAGERIATLALGEENGLFEPRDWTPVAHRQKLHGTKAYVPHAERADLAVVGLSGGSLAVVSLSEPGVERSALAGIDRSRTIGRLHFENSRCETLDGDPFIFQSRAPRRVAEFVRDAGLVTLAADAFGAASKLVALSADYARDRRQFGFPIAQFQSVKHQIARMGTEIEPTRALWWYAAYALDENLPDAERSAAMAKSHITDRALLAARAAVELHGGLGFTWECDVQIYFKRAMFDRASLGTPEVHRERCATLAGW